MANTHHGNYATAAQQSQQKQFLPDVVERGPGTALGTNANRSGFVTAKPSKRKRKFGKSSPDRATASTSRVGFRGAADRLANMQSHAS